MTKTLKTLIITAASLAVIAATASSASADNRWQNHHPRREQVNNRLNNQNRRIHQEVKEGDLTHAQAASLRQDDRQIRREERLAAAQGHSHISATEQRALNQQLNGVSQQIGK